VVKVVGYALAGAVFNVVGEAWGAMWICNGDAVERAATKDVYVIPRVVPDGEQQPQPLYPNHFQTHRWAFLHLHYNYPSLYYFSKHIACHRNACHAAYCHAGDAVELGEFGSQRPCSGPI
jgi:hypothetical protein